MCDHKRLKCTDNVLTCKDCGTVLPLEKLAGEAAEKRLKRYVDETQTFRRGSCSTDD